MTVSFQQKHQTAVGGINIDLAVVRLFFKVCHVELMQQPMSIRDYVYQHNISNCLTAMWLEFAIGSRPSHMSRWCIEPEINVVRVLDKGRNSLRILPLSESTKTVLAEHHQRVQATENALCGLYPQFCIGQANGPNTVINLSLIYLSDTVISDIPLSIKTLREFVPNVPLGSLPHNAGRQWAQQVVRGEHAFSANAINQWFGYGRGSAPATSNRTSGLSELTELAKFLSHHAEMTFLKRGSHDV